jgi:hypothetical protein
VLPARPPVAVRPPRRGSEHALAGLPEAAQALGAAARSRCASQRVRAAMASPPSPTAIVPHSTGRIPLTRGRVESRPSSPASSYPRGPALVVVRTKARPESTLPGCGAARRRNRQHRARLTALRFLPLPCHACAAARVEAALRDAKSPVWRGFRGGGRYWARTSDPQLVDSGQPFGHVRSSSLRPDG